MSFDAIETRVNAATMRSLSNARAYVSGGDFPVIFDASFTSALAGGIDGTRPQFTALDTDLAAYEVVDGKQLTIRGKTYIARNPQADAGLTLVMLEDVE